MISNKKAEKAVLFCYRVLFLLADPPIDFEKLLKQNEKKRLPDGWFYKYELNEDTTLDVINRTCKIFGLTKTEQQALKTTVLLGCSPAYPKEG